MSQEVLMVVGAENSAEKVLIGIKINDTNFQMQIQLKRNLIIKMQRLTCALIAFETLFFYKTFSISLILRIKKCNLKMHEREITIKQIHAIKSSSSSAAML